jgi:putative ABC transport system substrate-binding protein
MDRRRFLLTSLAGACAAPIAAEAQPAGKLPRIGVLSGNVSGRDGCLDAFRRGLNELGHVEGRTHSLEVRWSGGQDEAFPRLSAELVHLNVDVIVSFTIAASPIAKQATSTIPIVMASSAYPVELGLVASLARPGGNVTGLTSVTGEIVAKRLQLLKETVPSASRVAVLRVPGRGQDLFVSHFEAAAGKLQIRLHVIELQQPQDLPEAFQTAIRNGAQAIMSTQGPFFSLHRRLFAELALKHRLPSMSGEAAAPDAGALMFYGPSIARAGCHRAASYVDRILKGAKPADLPVEQPTKFEFVINLKTAKALGLTIPPSLVLRADQVIE